MTVQADMPKYDKYKTKNQLVKWLKNTCNFSLDKINPGEKKKKKK